MFVFLSFLVSRKLTIKTNQDVGEGPKMEQKHSPANPALLQTHNPWVVVEAQTHLSDAGGQYRDRVLSG